MISVCIATYNGAKYIKEQVDSIRTQLSESDEIIVSDDGSTDDTLAVLAAIGDSRIKVVKNEGTHGVTGNFENALTKATGDYVFLSDQDDVWLSTKVELFMRKFDEGAEIILSDCHITDASLNIVSVSKFKDDGVYTGILRNIAKCCMLGSCMAFRRENMSIFLPFPRSKYIYHDIWIGLTMQYAKGITILREPTMLYRRHENTVTLAGISGEQKSKRAGNTLPHKIVKRFALLTSFCKWLVAYKTRSVGSSKQQCHRDGMALRP